MTTYAVHTTPPETGPCSALRVGLRPHRRSPPSGRMRRLPGTGGRGPGGHEHLLRQLPPLQRTNQRQRQCSAVSAHTVGEPDRWLGVIVLLSSDSVPLSPNPPKG